jgi:hypothetical protein
MLVGSNDRGVDEQVFHVSITPQGNGHAFPDTGFTPAGKANIRSMPMPEFSGEIAPRTASSHDPENRLDEAPVVLGCDTPITELARQKLLNPLPLVIS